LKMQQKIEAALAALKPEFLQVEDESHMHSRGPQSHFKAVLVSEEFEGTRQVQRHQKVYAALGDLMQQFHALALHTFSPAEWQAEQAIPDSPHCQGGSLQDK